MALTYTHAEVAGLLRKTPVRFSQLRSALEQKHKFPKPLPGLGFVWSRPQVDAWIAGNGDVASALAQNFSERAVAAARAELEQTYGGQG